jgi:hypothetical protein
VLRLFDPQNRGVELRNSVLNAIILPAVRLAHRLHLSTSIYSTSFSPYAKRFIAARRRALPDIRQELWQFDALDACQAGKAVKLDEVAMQAPPRLPPKEGEDGAMEGVEGGEDRKRRDGLDVNYIMDIAPGLFIQTVKGDVIDEVRSLRKPRMVVAVTGEGRDDYPGEFEQGEEETLVGFLYTRIMQREQREQEKQKGLLNWRGMLQHLDSDADEKPQRRVSVLSKNRKGGD